MKKRRKPQMETASSSALDPRFNLHARKRVWQREAFYSSTSLLNAKERRFLFTNLSTKNHVESL
jgi:hypothetical protein